MWEFLKFIGDWILKIVISGLLIAMVIGIAYMIVDGFKRHSKNWQL